VRVWSLAPILDAAAEQDASVPRLLATLQDHNAPVNVARFSRDGRRIASGSDDTCVMISELRPGAGGATLGSAGAGKANVENWRPVQPLRGHSSNISDLAWSPDDTMLATASVDSTVCVWSVVERPYKLLRTITGHVGHVKGVAWDPLGRYLASQGDDGVRVWAVDGWAQAAHMAAEFKFSSRQTFFIRWAKLVGWLDGGREAAAAAVLRGEQAGGRLGP
jgi:protein HIRA/HIR1